MIAATDQCFALSLLASEVFAHIENEPLGAASLAQCHRATLSDGREVAVKIQHPDVRSNASTDMDTVDVCTSHIVYLVHVSTPLLILLPWHSSFWCSAWNGFSRRSASNGLPKRSGRIFQKSWTSNRRHATWRRFLPCSNISHS